MSITHATVDQAAIPSLPHAGQPLDSASRQQPSSLSSYVGVHRRRDGQDRSPDYTSRRRPGHRARHRR
jgi:hypothetical protein